jgi:hypothetical protein
VIRSNAGYRKKIAEEALKYINNNDYVIGSGSNIHCPE